MTKRSKRDNPLLAAGLVGVLGVDVAVCIALGYWGGSLAGDYFGGSKGWTLGGLFVGLAAGILSAVLLVKKVMEDADG
ncbi:AtpZ/AtpI family protein [Paenibacillus thermoaerophilus]|jgi:ATP synthase protein I|uniref:AtpZ/AtpI family protein n=1 Tax=Paenibacillus thermoaerophilus TaxID=1215385 RepID=A0ABW2V8N8_9BACL|nr:AtpZ/AtpI family protein [Paenibacillus thermoaerophilus]TMV12475.1 AtpZ/AtpI family protein [Paenibacillus thermoaerophilus]